MHLTEAEAQPAYTQEETNRIAVYKRTLPSVVNVTSSAWPSTSFTGWCHRAVRFRLRAHQRRPHHYQLPCHPKRAERGGNHQPISTPTKRRSFCKTRHTHLALLQINAKNLTPSILSESSDLQVGQNVYAIGNPFGLNGTMTDGIYQLDSLGAETARPNHR